MPVATSWSAAARMSLSLTFSAKKFQLFQPIGGVRATRDGAAVAFGATGACDEAVRDARARTAKDSETEMRMFDPRWKDFQGNSMPLVPVPATKGMPDGAANSDCASSWESAKAQEPEKRSLGTRSRRMGK